MQDTNRLIVFPPTKISQNNFHRCIEIQPESIKRTAENKPDSRRRTNAGNLAALWPAWQSQDSQKSRWHTLHMAENLKIYRAQFTAPVSAVIRHGEKHERFRPPTPNAATSRKISDLSHYCTGTVTKSKARSFKSGVNFKMDASHSARVKTLPAHVTMSFVHIFIQMSHS